MRLLLPNEKKAEKSHVVVMHKVVNFEVTLLERSLLNHRKGCKGVFTSENSHRRKFHTRMTFLISYRVYMMPRSFHILLFNGMFHVDKIHVWFKIANITHALPVAVYRQTDFTRKWVVVSRLHDTVARSRTGVKFSPRCEYRGEPHAGVTRACITFCGGIL